MQTVEPIRVQVVMPPLLMAALDAHRRDLEELPSRAETIRRLCEQALAKPSRKPRAKSRKTR